VDPKQGLFGPFWPKMGSKRTLIWTPSAGRPNACPKTRKKDL